MRTNSFGTAALATIALGASGVSANAVGWRTQLNCASDYYAYCSQYSPGTPEVKRCMRANGPKLSKACIAALISDGEVSAKEVAQRREQHKSKVAAAKTNPKAAEPKRAEAATKAADAKATPQSPKAQLALATKPQVYSTPKLVSGPKPAVRPKAVAVATVLLDEKTFDALKTREPRFVIVEQETAATVTPEPILAADTKEDVGVAASSWKPERQAAQPQDVAEVSEQPARSIQRPPGRMGLGYSSQSEEQAPAWWDSFLRMISGQ